ncbi:translocation/assembly module TamB domain-containing protein [Psychromonas sp. CNPT3]|uniref:translocation/assembly module TamB domain-containing protein n=1 Tax=Psychromonas sp. CNPT3 TaxID=314282 RepID=UPI0002E6C47C|nr:translocation/assembly module TamB domain-containing protein [Psychromonas sp. CNPT3]
MCKKITKCLLILLAGLSVILALLLLTHPGNKVIISVIESIEPRLSLPLTQGSVFFSPTFENISWQDDSTTLNIEKLNYVFGYSCLVQEICMQQVNIIGVNLHLPVNDSVPVAQEETHEPMALLSLPIKIHLSNIHLKDINVTQGDFAFSFDDLALDVRAQKSNVYISSTLRKVFVQLPKPTIIAPILLKAGKKKLVFTEVAPLIAKNQLTPIRLPFNLYLDPIAIFDLKVVQEDKNIFNLQRFETQLSFIDTHLEVKALAFETPETSFDLQGKIDFNNNYPLALEIKGKVKTIEMQNTHALLKGQKYQLNVSGDLSALKSKLLLTKKMRLELSSEVDLLTENMPYSLQLKWTHLYWPLTDTPKFQSKFGKLESQGALNDYTLLFNADYQGQDIAPGKVQLKVQGDLKKLNLESLTLKTLQGIARFSGDLSWSDKLYWQGDLNLDNLALKAFIKGDESIVSGSIKQTMQTQFYYDRAPNWSVSIPKLQLEGKYLQRDFSVDAKLSANKDTGANIETFNIINEKNKISIKGRLGEKNNLSIKVDIQDMKNLLADAKGKINAKFKVTGSPSDIKIKAHLNARKLAYQQSKLQSLRLDGEVTVADTMGLNLDLKAIGFVFEDQKIRSVRLHIKNTKIAKHDIKIKIKAPKFSSQAQLNIIQSAKNWSANLQKMTIKIVQAQQKINLVTPIHVQLKNKNIQLSEHCWQSTDAKNNKMGRLCFQKIDAGESGEVQLSLDNIKLQALDPYLEPKARFFGALFAQSKILWYKNGPPKIDVDMHLENASIKVEAKPGVYNKGLYAIDTFRLQLNSKNKKSPFLLQIDSPHLVNLMLKGSLAHSQDKPKINATIALSMPNLSVFKTFIPDLEQLNGAIKADVNIQGALDFPNVQGLIVLQDTDITSSLLPIKLNALNTIIRLDNKKAEIQGSFKSSEKVAKKGLLSLPFKVLKKTFSVIDAPFKRLGDKINKEKSQLAIRELPSGQAYFKGDLNWQHRFQGALHFYAHKLFFYDHKKINMLLSPDIYLTFDKTLNVKGNVLLNRAKIRVKELPKGAVSASKDVVFVDEIDIKETDTLPLALNLEVDLGNDFHLIAMGLDSFIKGELLVKKEITSDLLVHGKLKFERGSYRSFGQQLELQDSSILFQGPPESPYIDIEAIRDPQKTQDNVISGIRLNGSPDALTLTIFSKPEMAQQEALSYLTRGKSINAGSDKGSNNQLAAWLIAFGASQSDSVMSDIGDTLGLKDLSLSTQGSGDQQSVGISAEIAPGVEISYGIGVFESFSILALRYELFNRFYIEASSGLYQAIDAYYEFDWDP